MKSNILIIVILSVAALILGLWLNYQLAPEPTPTEHNIEGLFWPQSKSLADFTLLDGEGKPFTLENLKGKWSLVFFGYTHCPDVCPTTLALLKGVKQKLTNHQRETVNTQYLFVSVDGTRDTPEVMKGYTSYFDPEFIGLTGDESQISALARQLGVVYMKISGSSENDYLIDHSASILLFDPLGRMIALFSTPHTVEIVASRYLSIRHFLNQEYTKE